MPLVFERKTAVNMYGEAYKETDNSETMIGVVESSLEEYQKTQESFSKTLEIYQQSMEKNSKRPWIRIWKFSQDIDI